MIVDRDKLLKLKYREFGEYSPTTLSYLSPQHMYVLPHNVCICKPAEVSGRVGSDIEPLARCAATAPRLPEREHDDCRNFLCSNSSNSH